MLGICQTYIVAICRILYIYVKTIVDIKGRQLVTMPTNIINKRRFKIMTNKEYFIIMRYFNDKKISREELEKLLDFENLTMDEKTETDIIKLLSESKEVTGKPKEIIKRYVSYVKERSGSGVITWEEFIHKLKKLCLEDSPFGIRVQRFSNYSYWEVFFDHFSIKNENAVLTFDHEYYKETENDNAYQMLWDYEIDTENADAIIKQVSDKWDKLSKDGKNDVISALATIYSEHFVDKSRFSLIRDKVKEIWMSDADLVLEVGLRDYHITFVDGDSVSLRF
jgi:hypothetical protein